MAPRRSRRRLRRAPARNSGPNYSMSTTVQNYSDAFERQLATRSDRITVRGKQYFSQNWSTVQWVDTLDAQSLSAISNQFERWRIIKLIFKPVFVTSTASTAFAYGITDDSNITSSLSFSQITQQRVNNVAQIAASTDLATLGVSSGEFVWKPIDPTKWYYTTTPSGSDIRLTYPACFVAATEAASQTVNLKYVLFFTIEFEGQV